MTDHIETRSPPETAGTPPRVWTVYSLFAVTLVLIGAVTGALFAILYAIENGGGTPPSQEALVTFATKPKFLILSIGATALTIAASSTLAAKLSPRPLAERLGLKRSGASVLTLMALSIGAPALGVVLENFAYLAGAELSGTLKLMGESIGSARGIEIPLIILVISLGPGVAEELMFRGYVQTRLLERHGPLLGIAISSALFGAMHMDPLQSPLAAILGAYLGYVAYRFRSIWPAVAAHAFNNGLSALGAVILPNDASAGDPNLLHAAIAALVFWLCLRHVVRQTANASGS